MCDVIAILQKTIFQFTKQKSLLFNKIMQLRDWFFGDTKMCYFIKSALYFVSKFKDTI